jgi:hypothetical protein
MKEQIFQTHLTGEDRPSYAKSSGIIYMANEGGMDYQGSQTVAGTNAPQAAGQALGGLEAAGEFTGGFEVITLGHDRMQVQGEWDKFSADSENEEIIPETKLEVDEMVKLGITPDQHQELSHNRVELKGKWDEFRADGRNDAVLPKAEFDIDRLIELGVTPQQYQENQVLFERILHPEKVKALQLAWRLRFSHSAAARAEYKNKLFLINTLIAQGVGPDEFEAAYNWEAFFDPKADEGRKIIGSVFKVIVQAILSDFTVKNEATDAQGQPQPETAQTKDEQKDPEAEFKRKKSFARVLWGAVNERREKQSGGKAVQADERETQGHLINLGIAPEVKTLRVLDNTLLNDTERKTQAGVLLERLLTQQQEDALIRAHNFGLGQSGKTGEIAGVYDYTLHQLGEKMKILTQAGFSKDEIKLLLREGLAGSPGESQEDDPHDVEDFDKLTRAQEKRAIEIIKNLTDEQRVFVNDLVRKLYHKGVEIDLNDPVHAKAAAEKAREVPPGLEITDEMLDEIIHDMKVSGPLGEEAHIKDAEEIQEVLGAWTKEEHKLQQAGYDINDATIREQIEYAIENNLGPDQFGIKLPRKNTEPESGLSKNAQDLLNMNTDPEGRPERRRGRSKEDASPTAQTVWEKVQEAYTLKQNPEAYAAYKARYGELDLEEIQRQAYEELPKSLEDLAWQIGRSAAAKFGITGEFPVFEIIDRSTGLQTKDTEIIYDKDKTVARVNKANFIRWLRFGMMYQHDDNPDDELNFFQTVELQKHYRPITLNDMIQHPDVYFKQTDLARRRYTLESNLREARDDEERNRVLVQLKELPVLDRNEELLNEVKRETWLFSVSRTYDLNYRPNAGDEEGLMKLIKQMFDKSPFTKTVWGGKASMYWIMSMDQNFSKPVQVLDQARGKAVEKTPGEISDHRLGQALNSAYLAYYNLTDVSELRRILGADSALLNKKGLIDIRNKVADVDIENDSVETKAQKLKGYMTDGDISDLFIHPTTTEVDDQDVKKEAAKDSKGNSGIILRDKNGRALINEWKFVDKMNIFSSPQFNSLVERMVRAAIQEDVVRKYDLYIPDPLNKGSLKEDIDNSHFAETFAYTMTRWTGAQARNNQGAAGYDAWSKLQKTRTYRLKMTEPDYGGGYGNEYQVHQLKQLSTDLWTGTRTETKITDEDRETIPGKYGKNSRNEGAFKTPLEVFYEIQNVCAVREDIMQKARSDADKDPEHAEEIMQKAEFRAVDLAEKAAGQLVFPSNTMRYYGFDHLGRGMDIYLQIMKAEEIKLEKFTHIDVFKGVTFERDQFQAVVLEKFLKPMRYFLKTWKQMDLSQRVRVNVGKDEEVVWKEMSLAESMFGHEMLDVAEFWRQPKKEDGDYASAIKRAVKYTTRDTKGRMVDTYRIPHEIDAREIDSNRGQLIRQMAKTRLAAELYSHVDLHSNDPRFDFRFYETIYQALERIPGGIEGDEFEGIKGSRALVGSDRGFFTHEDINWIRRHSNTTKGWLYGIAFLKSIVWEGMIKGGFKGLGVATTAVTKEAGSV